ncbi:hypothetical protein DENIT_70035 [Pseudomonas veronii]|nr:hypothetical protein DENIT_70035 [Pseudomonas veronii]
MIPSSTILPVVIISPGAVTTTQIKSWDSYTHSIGRFTPDSLQAAEDLQKGKCSLTLAVAKDASSGRISNPDGHGSLSCMEKDGSSRESVLKGVLVDSNGRTGLASSAAGDQALFIVLKATQI